MIQHRECRCYVHRYVWGAHRHADGLEADGKDLAGEYTTRWPDTRVLFVSGYSDGIGDLVSMGGQFTYMETPFTPNALSAKVREILDGPLVAAKSA